MTGGPSYVEGQQRALEDATRARDTGQIERILGHMRAEGVPGQEIWQTISTVVDRMHHLDAADMQPEAGD